MTGIDLAVLWERLDLAGEQGEGYVRLRVPSVRACAAYAARRISSGIEALIIEVSSEAVHGSPVYPQSAGFEVRADAIEAGRTGRTRIILSLTDERYRDIFRVLCEDVVRKMEEVGSETDAVRVFVSRLMRWQAFVRKHGVEVLSLEARRGLYGELRFLRDFLLDRIEDVAAVSAWRGCYGADHDFQLGHGHVEVKTTSANTPHAFHVSNVGQLDDNGIPSLFLHLVTLEEGETSGESLPELVEYLRQKLDPGVAEQLEVSLEEAGFLNVHREQYALPKYTLRAQRFFKVASGFPRLCEEMLPPGVENVRYMVAVAACTPYELMAEQAVRELLP